MRFITLACAAALLTGGFASIASYAQAPAGGCQLEISANDQIQYDKKELKAPASCKEITLTLKHVGKLPATAMGHNWVLTQPTDAEAVASDGMKAGAANNFVKPSDQRVIAHTKVVGGGESTSVKFSTASLKPGEQYAYLCTFPGHSVTMRGNFILG